MRDENDETERVLDPTGGRAPRAAAAQDGAAGPMPRPVPVTPLDEPGDVAGEEEVAGPDEEAEVMPMPSGAPVPEPPGEDEGVVNLDEGARPKMMSPEDAAELMEAAEGMREAQSEAEALSEALLVKLRDVKGDGNDRLAVFRSLSEDEKAVLLMNLEGWVAGHSTQWRRASRLLWQCVTVCLRVTNRNMPKFDPETQPFLRVADGPPVRILSVEEAKRMAAEMGAAAPRRGPGLAIAQPGDVDKLLERARAMGVPGRGPGAGPRAGGRR